MCCNKISSSTITWYLTLVYKYPNVIVISVSVTLLPFQLFTSLQLMVSKISIPGGWPVGLLWSCNRKSVSCRYGGGWGIWWGGSVINSRCLPCWYIMMWRCVVNCLWELRIVPKQCFSNVIKLDVTHLIITSDTIRHFHKFSHIQEDDIL